jgi:hypothetical protein
MLIRHINTNPQEFILRCSAREFHVIQEAISFKTGRSNMTPHESQQHNQAAFAAMHKKLDALQTHRTLFANNLDEYVEMKTRFREFNLQYEEVTCTLSDRRVPGFRISNEAFIFLATVNLIQSN